MKTNAKTNEANAVQLHLTSKFTAAVDYARTLHIERRKGTGIPYMAHLLGVASLVMGEAGNVSFEITEEMVIAAVLHDAVEDHGGALRLKDIELNFGSNVARMVAGLSDSFSEDATQKDSWPKRKKAYIERLRHEPLDVQLISAADKLYNARAMLDDYREIGPRIWERFKRSCKDQLWYFGAVLDVLKASDRNRIVSELERVVRELERISKAEAG
jgi:(p)ppGpp synthase/HD superfamily hydrolase